MRTKAPLKTVFYHPTSEEETRQLAKNVAGMHVNAINARIEELNCPASQKLRLLDAVIAALTKRTT